MIKQYFKLVLRLLKRDKLFALINISGLAIGLASAFLILLFVMTEITFDMPHKKRNRIYRVLSNNITFKWEMPSACYPLKEVLEEEIPQIEKAARAINVGQFMVKSKNEYLEEKNLYGIDSEFFEIMTLPLLYGDYKTELKDPGNIFISEATARKYFGKTNATGNILEIFMKDTIFSFIVKGIFEDTPINSTFQANLIVNSDKGVEMLAKNIISIGGNEGSDPNFHKTAWMFNFTPVWFLLKEGQDIDSTSKMINEIAKKYIPENMEIIYTPQALKDVHFDSHESVDHRASLSGNLKYLKIFSSIGVLILLLVSINYIILSIARSTKRAKEIGIRKVTGADKKSIIKLVMSESIGLSILTLPISVTLAELMLPVINKALGLELRFDYLDNWLFTLTALLLTIFIGIISGSYLSFYLSKFTPITILREHNLKQKSISKVRKGLLVVQISIFILLLFSTYIIQKQFLYIHNMPMGFNKENLYFIPLTDNNVKENYSNFKNELVQIPGIKYAAGALACPPSGFTLNYGVEDPNDPENKLRFDGNLVDYDYMEAYEFEFVAGRSFSKNSASENSQIILNEKGLEILGIEDPIGKDIGSGEIIGIIKDFQIHSTRDEIKPVMIRLYTENIREMVVKLDPMHSEYTLKEIEKVWKKFAEVTPLEISTIDDLIKARHSQEYRFKSIINGFTLLAIFLAAMGLFGSCLYMAEQRSKEIGIRKIFGSKNRQILMIINTEFIKYTIIAMVIALPVGFYAMQEWLKAFAFRINITPIEFIASAIICLTIVLATISYISIKYSRANPVDSIRYE